MHRYFLLIILILSLLVPTVAQDDGYTIPADPEGIDPEMVIGRVGDVEITLGEFRQRVRYERFYYYFVINSLVEENTDGELILTEQNNQYFDFIAGLLNNLASEEDFVTPLYDTVILEQLYHQEATERGLIPDECAINTFWIRLLNLQAGIEDPCQLPPEFDEVKAGFIADVARVSGLTEQDILNIVTYRTEFDLVVEAVQDEAIIEDVQNARTRHIRVADEETANEVLAALEAGEDFQTLLETYTLDPGAQGNGGELGFIQRGQTIPEFENAAFIAEVGEIVGPVQTQFGYHIIEVLEQQTEPAVRARHILFSDEDDASQAIRILNNDPEQFPELARLYSIDTATGLRGGELGFVGMGQTVLEFEEALFNAEIGEIVGPVQTEFGYHIIEALETGEDVTAVNVRHILLETQDEAEATLERLNDGEDFAEVAGDVSIDPSAQGHLGGTRRLLVGGDTPFYAANNIPAELAEAVFAAEEGGFAGPAQHPGGDFYVFIIDEFQMRPPAPALVDNLRSEYVFDWQEEQLASDRILRTELWRGVVPDDPQPSDAYARLSPLDEVLAQAINDIAALLEETNIPNTLRTLTVPDGAGN